VFFKKLIVLNLSFLLKKSLLVIFIGFFVLTAAHAQISEEKAFVVKKTVQSQLAAFAADDAKLAFSFAAPGIQKLFKTPDNFMTMVQQAYPVVYRPANFLSPFNYWQIVGSVLVGYWLFNDMPDTLTWIGSLLVIASGVFVSLKNEK